MILYGKFLEVHDFYTEAPILLRVDMIKDIVVDLLDLEEVTRIGYVGCESRFIVKEDYETVRGLLGQVYGKKG